MERIKVENLEDDENSLLMKPADVAVVDGSSKRNSKHVVVE